MRNYAERLKTLLYLVTLAVSLGLLTSCAGSKTVLHPVTMINGECKYQGEDICYPAKGYTAFSDYYLGEVMEAKIK